jgi:hypothetical protein
MDWECALRTEGSPRRPMGNSPALRVLSQSCLCETLLFFRNLLSN